MKQDENKKTLVTYAIEKALLKIGKPEFEFVVSKLEEQNFNLEQGYENPEGMKRILQDIYGGSYKTILKNIEKELAEYSNEKGYVEFLKIMKK